MVAEPQVVVVANPQVEVPVPAPMLAIAVVPSNGCNDTQKKSNRIQVSNTKKPLFFYLNLAKRYIKQHNYVELSALGMAIPTAVTILEILKANGVAVERKVLTSTVGAKDETKGRLVQKAKLEIVLERNEKYIGQKASSGSDSKSKDEGNTETIVGKELKPESKADPTTTMLKVGEATTSKTETKTPQPN